MTEVQSHAASAAAGAAAQLYRTALEAGRATLDTGELARLLAAADLRTTTAAAGAIELSIRVHATREFGLVLDAGAGGLDAALDPANFARDRAAVHAAVELTDGADFLARFRRTIAWQRIAALAAHRGVQPPEAALARLFEAALQLAAGGLPDAPGAQVALHELVLDCASDGEAGSVKGAVPRRAPAPMTEPSSAGTAVWAWLP